MKTPSFFIALFVSIAFFAKGQNSSPGAGAIGNLYQHWRYLSGSGGIAGKGPGWSKENKVSIQFKKSGNYTFFEKGKKKQCDKFKIIEKESILSGKRVFIIDYKNNTDQSFQIVGDTLFLQEEVHDGFNTIFLKK